MRGFALQLKLGTQRRDAPRRFSLREVWCECLKVVGFVREILKQRGLFGRHWRARIRGQRQVRILASSHLLS